MHYLLLLILNLLFVMGCSDEEAVNTGGGLETETISNISGIIVDEEDKSIENAIVIATKSEGETIINSDTVLTGGNGVYRFTTLDTGVYTFRAEKIIDEISYHAEIGSHYNDQAAFSFGIDTLLATGTICGIVRTEDKKTSYMGITVYIPGTSFSARTDSEGRFSMSFVLLGSYTIVSEKLGYITDTSSKAVLQNPGDTARIKTVTLKESMGPENFSIIGSFLSSKSKTPFAYTPVLLEKLNDKDSITKTVNLQTDSKGIFVYHKGEPGTYRFSLCDTLNGIIFKKSQPYTFEQIYDQHLQPILVAPQNGYLRGKVLRENAPLNENNGTSIHIVETGRITTSDTLGNFSFDYISPGDYTLKYSASRFDTIEQKITLAMEDDITIAPTVMLPLSDTVFSLTASYYYPDGSVATGAGVQLYKYYQNEAVAIIRVGQVIWTGEVTFDSLQTGTYSLLVKAHRDDTSYADTGAPFTVTKLEPLTLPAETLQVYDPKLGKLTGSVSLNGTTQKRGIAVRLDHTELYAQTDKDGNFLLQNIPFGTYDCKFAYDGFIIDGVRITITSSYDTVTTGHMELKPIESPFIKMVHIKEGNFEDQHEQQAYISEFNIGKTEITLSEYRNFDPSWVNMAGTQYDYEPVAGVSFSQAIQFCNWLSIREGLDTCYILDPDKKATRVYGDSLYWKLDPLRNGYRLPSGDEWEHAAHGVENPPYGFDEYATNDGTLRLDENVTKSNAWIPPTSQNDIQKVLLFKANGNGLYDMTGNVWEYTWERSSKHPKGIMRVDFFEEDQYMNGPHIQVRGASAIWPDPSQALSAEEMKVIHSYDANSDQKFFSDAARGFRIVKR